MAEAEPDKTSEAQTERVRNFNLHMRDALHDFLRATDNNGTPAQFEEFIARNYPILIREIAKTPELCEQYMAQFEYINADSSPPEPLKPHERYTLARAAYRKFPGDTKFDGSDKAKVFAFQHYINMCYPLSLPDFKEQEAQDVMDGRSPPAEEAPSSWLSWKRVVGALGAIVLAGGLLLAITPGPREEKPDNRPNQRKFRDPLVPPVEPQWRPVDPVWVPGQPIFHDPQLPHMNDPLIPGQQVDREQVDRWQKEWLKRMEDQRRRGWSGGDQVLPDK